MIQSIHRLPRILFAIFRIVSKRWSAENAVAYRDLLQSLELSGILLGLSAEMLLHTWQEMHIFEVAFRESTLKRSFGFQVLVYGILIRIFEEGV